MKQLWFIWAAVLFFSGCGRADPACVLKLPEPPPAWTELFGSPQWRIEWINPEGVKESRVTAGDTEVTLPRTWASPVSAWPFWPDRGIVPGIFRPAGAIFPFDAGGTDLPLDWRGGVDALLYWELDAAWAAQAGAQTPVFRRARNFDWPRFRELLQDPVLSEQVRADPWTADWRHIAETMIRSGFDRRRIVPEETVPVPAPAGEGPWFGVSPFAAPWRAGAGEPPLFPVGTDTKSYFSAAGTLRINREAWILLPWP
jgi:hypothetical protein